MGNKDSIRDRILSRLPEPANAAAFREEMASTLAKNEKRLRLERWNSVATWLLAVGFFTACVLKGVKWLDQPQGHFMEFVVLLLLVTGAVEILKHMVNRTRVQLLKEVKQLQLQVLELQSALNRTDDK